MVEWISLLDEISSEQITLKSEIILKILLGNPKPPSHQSFPGLNTPNLVSSQNTSKFQYITLRLVVSRSLFSQLPLFQPLLRIFRPLRAGLGCRVEKGKCLHTSCPNRVSAHAAITACQWSVAYAFHARQKISGRD